MKANLIVEICPMEPRASLCTAYGESITGSQWESDILDCTSSGDCQDACEYVLDNIGVEFRIVAKDSNGQYVNRIATDQELLDTCKAIYFDSETEFSVADMYRVMTYLVSDAAHGVESECDA